MKTTSTHCMTLILAAIALGGCGGDGNKILPALNNGNNPAISQAIKLVEIGRFDSAVFNEGAAEIVAFDPVSRQGFVVNATVGLDVFDLSDPTDPTFISTWDVATSGNGVNSVDVRQDPGGSLIAVAVQRTLAGVNFNMSGYGSAMAKVPDGMGGFETDEFYLMTDRGANGAWTYPAPGGTVDAKVFPDVEFTPRIGRFRIVSGGALELLGEILLRDQLGNPLHGLPNIGPTSTNEVALDLDNRVVTPPDDNGIDSEGLVALQDGTFWISDEYGPHIAHFTANGDTLERINPFGNGFGGRALPPVYGTRRANRGMEGLSYVPAGDLGGAGALPGLEVEDWLVGIMQSPMENPTRRITIAGTTFDNRQSVVTRIVFFPANPASLAQPKEYLYLQELVGGNNSEIVYVPGSGGAHFLVLERDAAFLGASTGKNIFAADLSAATNVYSAAPNGLMVSFDLNGDTIADSITLESIGIGATPAAAATRLAAQMPAIIPAGKSLFLDLLAAGYPHDKPEGFAIIGNPADRRLVIINDDDFGIGSYVDSLGDTGQMFQKTLEDGRIDHPILYQMTADAAGAPNLEFVWEFPLDRIPVMVAADATRHRPGVINFHDASGTLINRLPAGYLPDMLTFTPDGMRLLVANEGEPNSAYEFDPIGSVSIVDLSAVSVGDLDTGDVFDADFTAFDSQRTALQSQGVRIYGMQQPGDVLASVAEDMEPEYIAVSSDSLTAWVSCQENNVLAVVNLQTAQIVDLLPLGLKDHSLPRNALDASDRDDAVRITTWPVFGMYQPDSIATYRQGGITYVVSANEGDARDYDGFSEDARVADLALDPSIFPDAAEIQESENLGRLKTTSAHGDIDGDGLVEQIHAYGARSFSIWGIDGAQIYDSGSDFEDITTDFFGGDFNNGNDENSGDSRSDDKGPEPEALALGEIDSRIYAFIGLERMGGIMVYDITDPRSVLRVQYINNRDLDPDLDPSAEDTGDLGPEGFEFVPAASSPTGLPLLIVANEVSGSTTVYEIR